MEKFLFADGQDICLFENGSVKKYASTFIKNYKINAESIVRAKKWKHSGEGALFRSDAMEQDVSPVNYSINGIYPAEGENEIVYSFTVNETSGIYIKDLSAEKADEAHVINSLDYEFTGGCMDASTRLLAISVRRNDFNSDIALFNVNTGDYKTVTDGDTLDEDPFLSPESADIVYFSSRGVGRDANGNFAGFSNASICKLNIDSVEVEYVKSSDKFSYIKPVVHDGKLYAIKTPAVEKRSNPILEIILIPVRIVQALANFINLFVNAFTGKSITAGAYSPAKGREYDGKKIYISGNLIEVDKELKKNARKKDSDYGFVPPSWQLVEVETDKVIKSGILDFDIMQDGTIIMTNGRRIFCYKDGKTEKICNTESCLKVCCKHRTTKTSDIFEF